MGFQHRKLMSDPINETSPYDCNVCYQVCVSTCSDYCPGFCIPNSPPYIDGYPPPVPISDSPSHTNPTNKFLIVTSTIIAATFLVLCCLVYYIKCFRRRGRSRSSGAETEETRDEFLDQDHGLIVDHPIWYINTIGLQPSIIHSIAVCKYKKGEGLVEGTDCSVCLNEFQEDETLRLLPKCNHAFHIPCIDTWLRSHTNCPMCRAPIVSDSGNRGPPSSTSSSSSSVNNEGPGRSEETQVVIMEEDGNGEDAERGTNGGVSEIRNEEDELGVENSEDEILQPMRRSASLDSMEACQIRNDIVNGNKTEAPSNSNSNTESSTGKEQSVKIVSRRAAAGNQSLLRSLQSNPIFMRRSASFSGKFSLSISNNSSSNSNNNNNNKSHGTNPTLRSF